MRISAALIVKNEESCLESCLKSIQGRVDEIVICDTGSTDKTIEIAKRYTDKIYTDYKWEDSFAKARNHVLSKCTGDWVLSIDADEVATDGSIELMRDTALANPTAYSIGVTLLGAGSNNRHIFPRFFKRCPEVYWKGAAHNYLTHPAIINVKDAVIIYGYSAAHKQDPDRTLRILKKAVADDPKLVREKFYLAREYVYRKDYANAIAGYLDYLKVATWGPEIADAWIMLGRCYWLIKDVPKAQDACLQALKINANFKEAAELMAHITGPKNSPRWSEFAKSASNEGVLFIRTKQMGAAASVAPGVKDLATVSKPKYPMDLLDPHRLFIENTLKEYRHVDVLEWGAGHSTRYFPEFLQKHGITYTWTSYEHHEGWFNEVAGWKIKGVGLYLAGKDTEGYLKPTGKYDVIYVDGRNRVKCLQHAKTLLKPDGVVILHDAERTRYHEGLVGYSGRFINCGKARLWFGYLNTIPRIIHQIWISPNKRPTDLMASWALKNPDFQYRYWAEADIQALGLKNQRVYDEYYRLGAYSGACNIARAEILERFGGVYIDADSECLTPLTEAPFMKGNFFAVFVVDKTRRIANSPIGSVAGHHIIKEYVRRQGLLKELMPSFKKSGPELFTSLIHEHSKVLPAYTFLPVFHRGYVNKVDGPIYANHYWDTTKKGGKNGV
jgi:glycosyltransferase involved in cell wall biosynthesis